MKTFDEQLADHKAAFYAGILESWEVQHARAIAGTRPWRDVRDYEIGLGDPGRGRVIIYFTDAEMAEEEAVKAERDKPKPPAPPAPITAAQLFAVLKAKGILNEKDRG